MRSELVGGSFPAVRSDKVVAQRVCCPFAVWLAVVMGWLVFASVIFAEDPATVPRPTPTSESHHLHPARFDLQSVPLANLATLEPAVATQLAAAQDSLIAVATKTDMLVSELSETFGSMGQLYHAYSLLDSAEACYRNAIHLTPNEFRWTYLLADVLQRQGRLTQAIGAYEHACALQSDNVACLTNLGKVYLQDNRIEHAQAIFTRAVTLDAKAAAAHEGLGHVALLQERQEDAVRHFETVLELVPAANRIHYPLAMAYRQLNDSDKATFHLSRRGTVGVKIEDPLMAQLEGLVRGERLHLVRGKLAFQAGRYEEAAAEFKTAISAAPQSGAARVNLGTTLVQLGQIEAALEQFREALRVQPDNPTAHYNLALLLLQQKHFDAAASHLQTAIATNPRDQQAHLQLGHALRQLGHTEEALTHYTTATELDSKDEVALRWAAEILARLGRFSEARELLEEAHRRFPHRGRTAHALARLLAACPDPSVRDGQRALELAQRVYAANNAPQHAETVALALAEVGRCEEARTWQRQLIALAEQGNNEALIHRLKTTLARYEQGSACRSPVRTEPSVSTDEEDGE